MAKNGKRQAIGGPSSPPPSETQFENPLELPPPPVNVQPAKLPKIALASRSLLSVSFRHIRPNWRCYIQYVDMAARKGDQAMERYLKAYESLPAKDKLGIWPEQICDMANVEPGELYGAVCRQMWESKAVESSTMCSVEHPEVLQQTIRFAKKPEHFHDREQVLANGVTIENATGGAFDDRMSGSLPDKKGSSINIFTAATAGAGEVKLPDLAQGRTKLKTFDEEVIEMSRDLETPDPPFVVKRGEGDVSS